MDGMTFRTDTARASTARYGTHRAVEGQARQMGLVRIRAPTRIRKTPVGREGEATAPEARAEVASACIVRETGTATSANCGPRITYTISRSTIATTA